MSVKCFSLQHCSRRLLADDDGDDDQAADSCCNFFAPSAHIRSNSRSRRRAVSLLSLWFLRTLLLCQRRHLIPSSHQTHPAKGNIQSDGTGMECHVSTPKPLKKRDVRPFLLLMTDETDSSISRPNSKFLPATSDDGTQKQLHQLQSVSLFSSRRSSDSGIVSPTTRHTADPSDSESTSITLPGPAQREADTARPITGVEEKGNKSDNKSEDGTVKRTPFCGRCRNHWPDKPVLVKGQLLSHALI